MASQAVLTADRGGHYSHVGMVVDSCGTVMVLHAVPGEPDFRGDEDRVKMERPELFFARDRAAAGAVCRLTDSVRAARAAEVAVGVYRRHVLFDHDYDDTDTTRMYCSELVAYALQRAGYDMTAVGRHQVDMPFLHVSCIFPSDIWKMPFVTIVFREF